MVPYVFALIPVAAVPFLLYCLWNFEREIRPHRSNRSRVVLSSTPPPRNTLRAIQRSGDPRILQLQDERRSVS